jgi:LPS sulfotransferase NodH
MQKTLTKQRLLKFFDTPPNDVHAPKIAEFFGGIENVNRRLPIPPEVRATRKLLICFTNRCGSNYLAEILASTGNFNLAGEVFNFDTVIPYCKERGYASLDDYILGLIQETNKNGNFAAKMSVHQLMFLNYAGILPTLFEGANYLLLERADKLGQAISFQIAWQTRRWTSYMKSEVDTAEISFDGDAISTMLEGIAQQYRLFDLFFSVHGIVPVLMSYENLVERPVVTTQMALDSIGLGQQNFNLANVRTERQRNQVNERFKREYFDYIKNAQESVNPPANLGESGPPALPAR